MTLQLLHSEFPSIVYEENFILFFVSVEEGGRGRRGAE
jgi:hypothetical protein